MDAPAPKAFVARHFVVIARDDHSSDRTPAILARWAEENPGRIIVVSDERGNLGARGNFSLLMERCQSPYFAFCGQDDIWLPQKLEISIKAIQQMESRLGITVPILVHSDVKIVDDSLQEMFQSYFSYKGINASQDTRLDHLLFNNVVVGCSLMANRVLLELSSVVPQNFVFEDWWVALVAASCGAIYTILEPTVLYRQHGNNQVGAGQPRGRSNLWAARHILQQPRLLAARLARVMPLLQSQADVLPRVAGHRMPRRNREFLRTFCLPQRCDEAAKLPWARRAWLVVRYLAIWMRVFPRVLRWCY